MAKRVSFFFALSIFIFDVQSLLALQFGVIVNASLIGPTPTTVNGSCQSCLCMMMNTYNNSIVGFNCLTTLQRCQLFSNYSSASSYSMQAVPNLKFYFRELPPIGQTTSSAVTTVPSKAVRYAYWPFDTSFNDSYGVYNGVSVNSATLSSTVGINGYGKALSVSRPTNQYMEIASPGFSLVNESFTLETWIYPGNSTYSNDFSIFGQCSDVSSYGQNRCLNILVRYGKPMISFYYGGDCMASTNLTMNRWTHLAFVHDFDRRTQTIYTNGILSCFLNGSSLYLGSSTAPLQIGGCPLLNRYFTGLIDEVTLITRAKAAPEILNDATLTFRYTFDAGVESYDSGPLRINGTIVNAVSSSTGRSGEAIAFNQSTSYFQTSNLVLFGTPNYPYTISMWIYPYSNNVGTLLLAWSGSWCLPLLGFRSSGILHAQHRSSPMIINSINSTVPISIGVWTHVGLTYASTSGVRLYINSTLIGSSTTATSFNSSSTPMNFLLGSCVNSTWCSCSGGSMNMGQYSGMVDDFRLYSRALNSSEINNLLN